MDSFLERIKASAGSVAGSVGFGTGLLVPPLVRRGLAVFRLFGVLGVRGVLGALSLLLLVLSGLLVSVAPVARLASGLRGIDGFEFFGLILLGPTTTLKGFGCFLGVDVFGPAMLLAVAVVGMIVAPALSTSASPGSCTVR